MALTSAASLAVSISKFAQITTVRRFFLNVIAGNFATASCATTCIAHSVDQWRKEITRRSKAWILKGKRKVNSWEPKYVLARVYGIACNTPASDAVCLKFSTPVCKKAASCFCAITKQARASHGRYTQQSLQDFFRMNERCGIGPNC